MKEELYLNALTEEAYQYNDKSLWRVYLHRAMTLGFEMGVKSVDVVYCGKCSGKITANY